MATKVKVNFNPVQVIANTGVTKKGKQFLANEILKISDPYVPFSMGTLKNSATVAVDGSFVKYSAPYARALWHGEIMVDPVTGASGFLTSNGFKSRKGVKKIKASDSVPRAKNGLPIHYNFKGGPTRGSHWVERAWAVEGNRVINNMQEALDKGLFK